MNCLSINNVVDTVECRLLTFLESPKKIKVGVVEKLDEIDWNIKIPLFELVKQFQRKAATFRSSYLKVPEFEGSIKISVCDHC